MNTFYFLSTASYDPATDLDNNPSNNPGFNTIDIDDVMGSPCMAGRSVTLNFFASDLCGNVAGPFPATFSITNNGAGPTILTQPSDMNVSCTGANGADLQNFISNNGGAVASDACGSNIVWTTIPATPVLTPICGGSGTVDIIFVATDECGFSNQTDQVTFQVLDGTGPTLDGSTDISEECGSGGNFADDQAGLMESARA